MRSLQKDSKAREFGRVIAQGMQDVKVGAEKNMAKAAKRHTTMLNRAADQALKGA